MKTCLECAYVIVESVTDFKCGKGLSCLPGCRDFVLECEFCGAFDAGFCTIAPQECPYEKYYEV